MIIPCLPCSPMLAISRYYPRAPYIDGSQVPTCVNDLTSLWACAYVVGVTALFFFVPLLLLVMLYLIIGR